MEPKIMVLEIIVISFSISVLIGIIVYLSLRKGLDEVLSGIEKIEPERINERMNATIRFLTEEVDKIRKDFLKVMKEEVSDLVKKEVEGSSVSRKEFERLKETVIKLGGREEIDERIEIISKLFDAANPVVLFWQCKLIQLLGKGGGLAPDAEEDLLREKGIPIESGKRFLKELSRKGIVLSAMVERYNLHPEYLWMMGYTRDADWLRRQLEEYLKREDEYQKFIRQNINLVEEGLIVIAEQYDVPSGRIDIVCRDRNGIDTIVELKYPKARSEVIGQLLKYREDFMRKSGRDRIRLILVAPKIPRKTVELLKQNNMEWKEIEP